MIIQVLAAIFRQLSPLTQFGGWGTLAWATGVALTMVWVIGLHKAVRQGTAKMLGPISLAGFAAMIGITLLYWATGLVSGLIMASLNTIPLFRFLPGVGNYLTHVIAGVMNVIFMIGLVWYVLKHLPQLLGGAFNALKLPFQKGYNLQHLIAGAAAVGFIVNSASLNQHTFFIPMLLSAALGFYTLVGVRPQWSKIKDELAKGHAVAFGTLPNDQPIRTKKDRKILREAYSEVDRQIKEELEAAERAKELAEAQAEVEQLLHNGEEDKWVALENKMAVRKRIAEQLNLRLETEEETLARIDAAKQAEAEAEALADEEAQEEAEKPGRLTRRD